MAKRKPYPQYRSTESSAYLFHEDRKFGRWQRIQVKFPLDTDRRSANIDWASEENRRTFRGRVPDVGIDYNNITTRPPKKYDDPSFQFVSDAKNGSNVPEGYYVTSSGLSPIDFIPFTQGAPVDDPTIVDPTFQNDKESTEFFVANNVETENRAGDKHPYISDVDPIPGRFAWELSPDYQAPTPPEVRYPKVGAFRKKFFRNS